MTADTVTMPTEEEVLALSQSLPAAVRARQMVLQGRVLDSRGEWVAIDEALEARREIEAHLERGEIKIGGEWVSVDEAVEARAGTDLLTASETARRVDHDAASPAPQRSRQAPGAGPAPLDQAVAQVGGESMETRAAGNGVLVATLKGRTDQSNAGELKAALEELTDRIERGLVLDFEPTDYMSSAGWAVIAAQAHRYAAHGKRLCVCGLHGASLEQFTAMQLESVVPSFADLKMAVHAAQQPGHTRSAIAGQSPSKPGRAPRPEHERSGQLVEQVKAIIAERGPCSLFQLRRHLREERFGAIEIGPIRLYRALREVSLETHAKRLRYFRSC